MFSEKSVHAVIFLIMLLILLTLNCTSRYISMPVIIDHSSLNSTMTDMEIATGRNTRLYFEHASVGGNISSGLDSLALSDTKYSRTNFVFSNRGNPGADAKINLFYSNVITNTPDPSTFAALMFKFCYIDNGADMDALFSHVKEHMNDLEYRYPDKIFVWWTMPLQTTGDANRDRYNLLVRNYCRTYSKFLFDIADIESHDPSGNLQTNGGYEAMYPSYSSDGGHLNSAGYDRVARAFWYLAYRIGNYYSNIY